MKRGATIFIIVGERSGDMHASHLCQALFRQDPSLKIVGYGGDMMQETGVSILRHYRDVSFMGLWEVIRNFRTIAHRIKECKRHILEYSSDLLILVDFPGFNLRMAEFAKANDISTCYYISPKIWAWKKNRITKIRAFVDRMLLILPFEYEFYKSLGFTKCEYVGNPLKEEIEEYDYDPTFRLKTNGNLNIAVLPGSRIQEVTASIDIVLELARQHGDWQFHLAGVDNINKELYSPLERQVNCEVYFEKTFEIQRECDVAVVTSGTATLETALLGIPQVVVYRTSQLTYLIARWMVNIKFISLVNLVAQKEVVKELIQNDYNPSAISKEIQSMLHDESTKKRISEGYSEIQNLISNQSASKNAAEEIFKHF